ncbi:hypothetical protein HK098_006684 [Nowakowskiella sp. JEL0407]|nr:hypothetical protein HK098_006684 [Nowakowskiella sp. JEL0407]
MPPVTTNVPICIHITGFGAFNGVPDNPTTHVISQITKDIPNWEFPGTITTCIFETSGKKSREMLLDILDHCSEENSGIHIFIHLGVYGGSETFRLENCAYNEATFRIPDEAGWTPIREPIDPQYSVRILSSLDMDSLLEHLEKKFLVVHSMDPGRFVCNWIYYNSLKFCNERKAVSGDRYESMFMHVPMFDVISMDEQVAMVKDLCFYFGNQH